MFNHFVCFLQFTNGFVCSVDFVFLLSLSSTELLHGMFMIPANTPEKVLLTSDIHGSSYLLESRNKVFFYGRARRGRNVLPAGLEWQCFLAGAKRAGLIQNICNVLEFLQHQLDMKKTMIVRYVQDFFVVFDMKLSIGCF